MAVLSPLCTHLCISYGTPDWICGLRDLLPALAQCTALTKIHLPALRLYQRDLRPFASTHTHITSLELCLDDRDNYSSKLPLPPPRAPESVLAFAYFLPRLEPLKLVMWCEVAESRMDVAALGAGCPVLACWELSFRHPSSAVVLLRIDVSPLSGAKRLRNVQLLGCDVSKGAGLEVLATCPMLEPVHVAQCHVTYGPVVQVVHVEVV